MRAFLARVFDRLRRTRIDAELREELEFHRARLDGDARREGTDAEEAAWRARRRMGSEVRTREQVWDGASLPWLDHLAHDIRVTLRAMRRTPGFTLAALSTLLLGIGATTVIFSMAWAIWLAPLPYSDPGALVDLGDAYGGGAGGTISVPELEDYDRTGVFDGVAGYQYGASIVRLGGEPVRVLAFTVSPNLFDVLGVRAALGRAFTAADTSGDGAATVVLSDRLWRQRFHADTAIIGRTIEAFGGPHTIIGVMPPRFRFPQWLPSDMWVPRRFGVEGTERDSRFLSAIARVRSGRSMSQVTAAMDVLTHQLADAHPASSRDWSMHATPMVENAVGAYRGALGYLLGTVGLLFLIACANIASLLLARTTSRRKELAVRVALGATRTRVTRLVLTESLLLSLFGGLAGVIVARVGVSVLGPLLAGSIPRADLVAIGTPVIVFAATVSFAAGLLCGLAPSLRVSALAPADALQSGGRSVLGAHRRGLQELLVIGEVALSLVLLVGAGMMMRSFLTLTARDHGFEASHVLTMHVTLPGTRYPDVNARQRVLADLAERVRRLPGVADAGMVTGYPGSSLGILGGGPITPDPGNPSRQVVVAFRAAGPSYFRTMGVPVLAGRAFDPRDRVGAPTVAIVNRELATRVWPGADPLGRVLPLPASLTNFLPSTSVEVVGIVGDMHLGAKPSPELFVPLAQVPMFWSDLVVRVAGQPESHVSVVRNALRSAEPDLLIEDVASMDRILSRQMALPRIQSLVAGALGALGCALAGIGLFGLLSYLVTQRLPEFGVRMALGATRAHLFAEVMRRGLGLTAVGLLIGALGSWALLRLLRNRLFGLHPNDAVAWLVAVGCLVLAATMACWLPARRATRAHPVSAMRGDA